MKDPCGTPHYMDRRLKVPLGPRTRRHAPLDCLPPSASGTLSPRGRGVLP